MNKHILIIGGTGMLADATVELASRCDILTLVAQSEASLARLDQATVNIVKERHLLRLDWSDEIGFLGSLSRHVKKVGEPSLILAWLHNDLLGPKIAAATVSTDNPCDFYQVRGSAAAAPNKNMDAIYNSANIPTRLQYHQIILGFQLVASRSRWLHDSEISSGVLAAIDKQNVLTIVGSIEPWSRRP